MPAKDIISGIINLIEKHREKEKQKFDFYVNDVYAQVKTISTDLLQVITELEQLLKNSVHPNDVIDKLKKERNNLLVERRYIRHILEISYFDNGDLKDFVYGVLMILNGGDLKSYTEIRTNGPPRMGHALLDIVDHYESVCSYAGNNSELISNELLRVFSMQKQYIEIGIDKMTKAFIRLQEKRN